MAGHANTVQLLLDNGAPVDVTDLSKHTPLLRACEMGHTDVAQTLIDYGAKVNTQDQDGRSPLHWYVSWQTTGLTDSGTIMSTMNLKSNGPDEQIY